MLSQFLFWSVRKPLICFTDRSWIYFPVGLCIFVEYVSLIMKFFKLHHIFHLGKTSTSLYKRYLNCLISLSWKLLYTRGEEPPLPPIWDNCKVRYLITVESRHCFNFLFPIRGDIFRYRVENEFVALTGGRMGSRHWQTCLQPKLCK